MRYQFKLIGTQRITLNKRNNITTIRERSLFTPEGIEEIRGGHKMLLKRKGEHDFLGSKYGQILRFFFNRGGGHEIFLCSRGGVTKKIARKRKILCSP